MTVWGVGAGGSGADGAGVAGWTVVVLTATVVEEILALIFYCYGEHFAHSSVLKLMPFFITIFLAVHLTLGVVVLEFE
jgi:hypothetical protein